MDTKEQDTLANGTAVGQEIFRLIDELYPLCRSITGDGLRKTIDILRRHIPLEFHEVPTGTRVFDWTVPKEWNIRDAYVISPKGEKIIDFRESNLHVVNYSVPVKKTMPLSELKGHLHTLPAHPNWIPYKTSYYREDWGFCLRHNDLLRLEEGDYEVLIDSTLEDGFLTYGELFIKGKKNEEILISTHSCHPSLANDNLSGIGLATLLAKNLVDAPCTYSYRFLFNPGAIGAITWLFLNQKNVRKIRGGLVITGVGDKGNITYKRSRRGDAEVDRAASHVLHHSEPPGQIFDFSPYGYDERHFCSSGFNLPIGRISRTPYGEYPEYHTSADNLEFVSIGSLGDCYTKVREILYVLENDGVYINLSPMCEPQLEKRGLYSSIEKNKLALLWTLNLSDGRHGLLDIAERSGLRFRAIQDAAHKLVKTGLLEERLEHSAEKGLP
jgi:aminopeptidase-like protein